MKQWRLLGLFVVSVWLLSGCGAVFDPFAMGSNVEESLPDYTWQEAYETADYGADEAGQEVVVSGFAEVESKQYSQTLDELRTLIQSYDGKVTSQDASHTFDEYTHQKLRWTHFSVRIPSDQVETLLTDIQEKYALRRFAVNSYDAGDELATDEKRLAEIAARMAEIDGALASEDVSSLEKSTLREEQQDLELEQRSLVQNIEELRKDVADAQIDVSVFEVLRYTDESASLGHQFQRAFSGFFSFAIPTLALSLVSLFFVIPYIIVAVVTYLLVRKLLRWVKRKEGD